MTAPHALRLLIVEDDDGIGSGLVRATASEGFDATWCRTAREVRRHRLDEFDLVVLDLGLPDVDGLDLCRTFRRSNPTIPIIILTARDSETDIVIGLDAGADDYLVKPFRLAELLARLRAHTRRLMAELADTHIEVGALHIDVAARRVQVGGNEINLRPKEYDLLLVLAERAGRVVTRDRVMDLVWGDDVYSTTKTLDVHMAALRKQLGEHGPDDGGITTLRGVGYRLEHPQSGGG